MPSLCLARDFSPHLLRIIEYSQYYNKTQIYIRTFTYLKSILHPERPDIMYYSVSGGGGEHVWDCNKISPLNVSPGDEKKAT